MNLRTDPMNIRIYPLNLRAGLSKFKDWLLKKWKTKRQYNQKNRDIKIYKNNENTRNKQ